MRRRKMVDDVKRAGRRKQVDFAEIVGLLESKKYCEFMEQRGLCDEKCAECRKDVMDVIRGIGFK